VPDPYAPLLDSPPLRRYGHPEYVRGDAPAAGAEFTREIEGRYLVRLLSLFVRLVTDATVASRTLRLEFRDDADRVYDICGNPVTYPASSTEDYSFSVWQPRGEWEVSAANLVPLHPLLLPPTHDFHIEVTNIQATDQLSLISWWWERFYSGDDPGAPSY